MCPPSYERHEAIFNDTERLPRMGGPILYILKCTIYKGCWIAVSMLHCLGTPLNHSGEPTVRRIFLAFLILIGTATGAVATDKSETIVFPFDPQVGDVFYYRIEKSEVTEGPRPSSKMATISDISIEFLGVEDERYACRLTYLDIQFENEDPINDSFVEQLINAIRLVPLDYNADKTGSPLAFPSLQGSRSRVMRPVPHYFKKRAPLPQSQSERTKQFLENLSAKSANELFLKNIANIFTYTGATLPTNVPFEEETAIVWQLTGTELVRNLTTEVVSVDGDIATLRMRGGYTRDSVLSGITTFLKKTGAGLTSKQQKAMRAGLQSLKTFDIRLEYDAKMSISNGWPVEVSSTMVTDTGKAKSTIHYDITRLAEKPGPAK